MRTPRAAERESFGRCTRCEMHRSSPAIVGPDGTVLAGPLHDLYAEIDVADARNARRRFDPLGYYYARHDAFSRTVDTTARGTATFRDGA